MNCIQQIVIGIFSLPLTLVGSQVLSMTEKSHPRLVAPQKGEYTTLTPAQIKQQLSNHQTLLLEGIVPDNVYTWYDVANEYRRIFDNKEALIFAQVIYHTLILSPYLSDRIKSLSYRCLSKIKRRNGDTQSALQLASEAVRFGKNTDTYGQALKYLGDLFFREIQDEERGNFYFQESLSCAKKK